MSESLNGDLYSYQHCPSPLLLYLFIPIGVEDSGRVATEEGYLLRHTPLLVDRDDGKGASSAGFPID